MEDILLYFAYKYHGDYSEIYQALMNNEKVDFLLKEKWKKTIRYNYTTIISNDYPKALKQQYYPPFVLFYQGNLNLLDEACAKDFRTIHGSNRFYYASKGNEVFFGVENPSDLELIHHTMIELMGSDPILY